MTIQLELIDYSLTDRTWWREVMSLLLRPGEAFELRCWREETECIRRACRLGALCPEQSTDYEVSVTGVLTPEVIRALLESAGPEDADGSTEFFTIRSSHISSSHYGRELYLFDPPEQAAEQVDAIILPLRDSFIYGPVEP